MEPLTQLSSQNPWPGLRPFTENDREFFFGRERETAELLALVQRSSVVVLYGQSGLGKTSMLQAGLLPDLKRLDFLPLRVRFDHSEEAPSLSQQIKSELASALDSIQIASPRPGPDETLWEYFHRRDLDFWGPRNRLLTPLIVLDQFEEVFTLGQRSEKSAARVACFATELEAVLEHRPPAGVRKRLDANPDEALHYDLQRESVKFLISLREDFLPDLDPWRVRMPSLLPNRFRLERMTGAQALEVVRRGGRDLVDVDVARDIVDFVSRSQRAHVARSIEQRDVEPALLSVVCDELNRRRVEAGRPRITADFLSKEREEIIQDFYERAFVGIHPGIRDWVEDRLLTASGYRNRSAVEDALKEGLPADDLERLIDRRVLHREERGGVVWVELSHDLLSDPASRSRTAREQRRQADESRRQKAEAEMRESMLRAELRKSRRRTAIYGILLLGTAAALILAVLSWRSDIASQHRAEGAERGRKESYQTATEMAERFSLGIGGSNWIPAATVLQNIQDGTSAYENLSRQASSEQRTRIDREHARFLIKAADSLFQIGHFEDGLRDAQSALEILQHAPPAQAEGDARRLSLAEASYEAATGLLETGKLSAAANSFDQAMKFVAPIPNSQQKSDFARVFVLSQLGLGQIEVERFQLSDADNHFRAALDFSNNGMDSDEALSWRILALQGRGASQWSSEQALTYYAKAAEILGTPRATGNHKTLRSRSPKNPRWQMLAVDLAYRQGWSTLSMGQYETARKYFEQSEAEAEDLCRRDCSSALDARSHLSATGEKTDDENWLWRLMLLQAWKGLGLVHDDLREWDSSLSVLQASEIVAEELNRRQPSWTHAGYLHAAVEWNLGQLQKWRYSQYSQPSGATMLSFSAGSDPQLFRSADEHFREAQNILMRNGYATSEDREFIRLAYLASSDQGELRAAKAKACHDGVVKLCVTGNGDKPVASEKGQATADQLNREAIAKYREALGQLQPIAAIGKESTETLTDEGNVWSSIGQAFLDLKQYSASISAYETAIEKFGRLAPLVNTSDVYNRLASTRISLGDVYRAKPDLSGALTQFNFAEVANGKALELDSKENRPEYLATKALIHSRFADILLEQGDLKSSLAELREAITVSWGVLKGDYADVWLNGNMKYYRTGSGATLDSLEKVIHDPATSKNAKQIHLTPEENKAMLGQIAQLRKDYDPANLLDRDSQSGSHLPYVLPGAWRAVPDFANARKWLLNVAHNLEESQIRGIRELPLLFYPDTILYEADVEIAGGRGGTIDVVRRGTESKVLDGSVDQIRDLNKTSPPRLETPERAIDYLRFVLKYLHTQDDGYVQLVDELQNLRWLPSALGSDHSDIAAKIRPLILERSLTYDGDWQAIGTAAFGGRLELISFHLSRDGNLSIAQERPLTKDRLPIFIEVFSNGIRVQTTAEALQKEKLERELSQAQQQVKDKPTDTAALEKLPGAYAQLSRWKEAAEAQRALIGHLQREGTDNKADNAAKLRSASLLLSAYQLFNGDFAGALATSSAVKKTDASDLYADKLRAHSLLFLGHTQEAEAIYLQNIGKKIGSEEWSEAISSDFGTFEKLDLGRPEFERMRNLMALEQAQHMLKVDPGSPTALRALAVAYGSLKRWHEAVSAEKNWVAFLQNLPADNTDRVTNLRGAYLSLSWYQLFARDFAGALASTEAGKKVDESYLFLDTNRAHALMFLGRSQEAETIYLGNRGKKFDPKDDESWEHAILNDFDELEADGLSNPEIAKIRKLLRSPR